MEKHSLSTRLLGLYTALVLIFIMAPIVVVVAASFTDSNFITFPPRGLSVKWYHAITQSPEFMAALRYSLYLAGLTAVISGTLGTLAAFAIQRFDFPGKTLIAALLTAPLMVPAVVLAIGLLQMFAMLPSLRSPMIIVYAHVVVTIPYVLRMVLGSMAVMDPNLERAAAGLGAGAFTILRHVILPQIWTGVVAGMVFAFIVSFDDAALAVFLVGTSGQTLPVAIFNYITFNFDPLVTAVGSLSILLSFIAAVVLDRLVGLGGAKKQG